MESELSERKRVPVSKRLEEVQVNWETGEQLRDSLRRYIIGVRGDSGTGKTHTIFSLMQDSVIERAEDDEYIKEFFEHDPEILKKVLEGNIVKRRSYLRAAHKIVFIDFDKRGADPLFQSFQCHHALYPCFQYTAVNSWEEAFKAMVEGTASLDAHAAKWGPKGCWFVVDNSKKAWQLCQGDYSKSVLGMDFHELVTEAALRFPGKDSAARKAQSDWLSENKDFTIISPMFDDEFLGRIILTGYHVLILSLNTKRKIEVDQGNGVVGEEDVPMLGGSPNAPALMNYIFRKFKSKDGTYKAEIVKARHFAARGNVIVMPTFGDMRREMERLEREHVFNIQSQYNAIQFEDELILPNGEIFKFGTVSAPTPVEMSALPPLEISPPTTKPPSLADIGKTRVLDNIVTPQPTLPEIEELADLDIAPIELPDNGTGPVPDIEIASIDDLDTDGASTTELVMDAWECNFCNSRNSFDVDQCEKCSLLRAADPKAYFIVKDGDKGKGKYHMYNCAHTRRISNKLFVTDFGDREPCKCIAKAEDKIIAERDTKEAEEDIDINEENKILHGLIEELGEDGYEDLEETLNTTIEHDQTKDEEFEELDFNIPGFDD